MRFGVLPHRRMPNDWRVLTSLSALSCLLDIDLGLEELAYLYEFCSDGSDFTFVTLPLLPAMVIAFWLLWS